jgi:hypothetical protein
VAKGLERERNEARDEIYKRNDEIVRLDNEIATFKAENERLREVVQWCADGGCYWEPTETREMAVAALAGENEGAFNEGEPRESKTRIPLAVH